MFVAQNAKADEQAAQAQAQAQAAAQEDAAAQQEQAAPQQGEAEQPQGQTPEQAQEERWPVKKDGTPDYDRMTPQQEYDYMVENYGEEAAQKQAQAYVESYQEAINNIQAQLDSRKGTNSRAAMLDRLKENRARLEAWRGLVQEQPTQEAQPETQPEQETQPAQETEQEQKREIQPTPAPVQAEQEQAQEQQQAEQPQQAEPTPQPEQPQAEQKETPQAEPTTAIAPQAAQAEQETATATAESQPTKGQDPYANESAYEHEERLRREAEEKRKEEKREERRAIAESSRGLWLGELPSLVDETLRAAERGRKKAFTAEEKERLRQTLTAEAERFADGLWLAARKKGVDGRKGDNTTTFLDRTFGELNSRQGEEAELVSDLLGEIAAKAQEQSEKEDYNGFRLSKGGDAELAALAAPHPALIMAYERHRDANTDGKGNKKDAKHGRKKEKEAEKATKEAERSRMASAYGTDLAERMAKAAAKEAKKDEAAAKREAKKAERAEAKRNETNKRDAAAKAFLSKHGSVAEYLKSTVIPGFTFKGKPLTLFDYLSRTPDRRRKVKEEYARQHTTTQMGEETVTETSADLTTTIKDMFDRSGVNQYIYSNRIQTENADGKRTTTTLTPTTSAGTLDKILAADEAARTERRIKDGMAEFGLKVEEEQASEPETEEAAEETETATEQEAEEETPTAEQEQEGLDGYEREQAEVAAEDKYIQEQDEQLESSLNDKGKKGKGKKKSGNVETARTERMLDSLIEDANGEIDLDDDANLDNDDLFLHAERGGGKEPTPARREATKAVLGLLEKAGLKPHIVSEEEAQRVLGMLGQNKKTNWNDALSAIAATSHTITDTGTHGQSSNSKDGAKVRQHSDITNALKKMAEALSGENAYTPQEFVGQIALALGIKDASTNKSNYTAITLGDGTTANIRVSNHQGNAINFTIKGKGGEVNIGFVIKDSKTAFNPDSNSNYVEFVYYGDKTTEAARQRAIVDGIRHLIETGEFGRIPQADRVNTSGAFHAQAQIKAYHGTHADFDRFDHSHMGEGEGAQAYGWGTYATEVKDIGRTYAVQNTTKHNDALRALQHDVDAISDQLNRHRDDLKYDEEQLKRANEWRAAPELDYELFKDEAEKLKEKYGEASPKYRNHLFNDIYTDEMKRAQNSVKSTEESIQYRKEKIAELEKALKDKQAEVDELPKKFPRHLYTVEIPADNGSNYLSYAEAVPPKEVRRTLDALYDRLTTDEEGGYDDKTASAELRRELDALGDEMDGNNLYGTVSSYLGSDEAASKFLSSLGFTGIKYPADYRRGGRADGALNYVVFDENDLQIKDRVELMETPDGTIYGWATGGEIYLVESRLNPETPLHEYTHLWDAACRRTNPELWRRGVELMKQTPLWEEVKNDPNYANLTTDDEIAGEVHARLSGRDGAALLERMAAEAAEKDAMSMTERLGLVARLRKWMADFWRWTRDTFAPWTKAEAAEVSLDDFVYAAGRPRARREPERGDGRGRRDAANQGQGESRRYIYASPERQAHQTHRKAVAASPHTRFQKLVR